MLEFSWFAPQVATKLLARAELADRASKGRPAEMAVESFICPFFGGRGGDGDALRVGEG